MTELVDSPEFGSSEYGNHELYFFYAISSNLSLRDKI
jgi:hypothetical protein